MIDIKYLIKRSNQHGSKNIWTIIIVVNGIFSLIFELHAFSKTVIFKGNLNKDDSNGKVYVVHNYIRCLYKRNSKSLVKNQL